MDVRLRQRFAEGAIEGSVNYPLYQPISGWGLPANIRRAGFAFFGIYGTERNLNWLSEVEAEVRKGAPCTVFLFFQKKHVLGMIRSCEYYFL